ncbi:MAG: TlpA family protein disulfide reductase [Chloroflexi bacterium]|nr:TlpA family protein disulfide reductase [Chloroflexota bacterium]
METTPRPAKNSKVSPALIVFLIFPLLGLIAAAITALSSSAAPLDNLSGANSGQATLPRMDWNAPNITLTALDGTAVEISDFRGRVVFLNFWATWCPPCVREMPAFSQFAAEQDAESGALVVAINVGESAAIVDAFLTETAISGITVLLDPLNAARNLYGVITMPTTYIIDSDGIVRFFKFGEMTLEDMYSYMAELGG